MCITHSRGDLPSGVISVPTPLCLPALFQSAGYELEFPLKRIEKEAFSGCSGLREIEIPASVEVLCEGCFWACRSLQRVTFASGSCLKRIEKEAFGKCSGLREIEIPASVEMNCQKEPWYRLVKNPKY